jgi:putative endonuclease
MATHLQTGQEGEALAAAWLQQEGYVLLHQNWRFKHWELDIVAEKGGVLHLVEVKTLRSNRFGYPEQQVGHKKRQSLAKAAEQYLLQYPQWQRIQFDVLSITLVTGQAPQFYLLEDIS